ncbi:M64 family metallopeptidase [Streptomyces sp. NPDC005017]|uniref:M64 family metallopeptidase n=1 Tax=Streptomyces sp. NPDC005017 TaxID=3364706 RepID=UPI0036B86551
MTGDARKRWLTSLGAGLAATAALLAAGSAPAAQAAPGGETRPQARTETHEVEYFAGPNARPRHIEVRDSAHRTAAPATTAPVTPLQRTGPANARLDLVVIGDGYTASEQGDFTEDARRSLDAILAIEPYRSYRGLFNIWLVEAASPVSGVSGDPTADVTRDTVLGSYFFCEEIERLLCVDTDAVTGLANRAPAADIVFVIANSTKYGGAGYTFTTPPDGATYRGIATMSSDNERSYLIGAHELGHSIGNLADEYQYAGYGAYPDPEATDINLSTHRDLGTTKWHRWVGEQDPTGSAVGTYEGGGYYETGVFRPTDTSIMRTLTSTEFNLVGREAMIAGFYAHADTLTSRTPTSAPISRGTRLTVGLAPLTGLAAPRLTWYADGKRVDRATNDLSVTPAELGVRGRGPHTIRATVTDGSASLRDPSALASAANSLTWLLR